VYPRLTDCWMQGLPSPRIRTGPGPRPDTPANGTYGQLAEKRESKGQPRGRPHRPAEQREPGEWIESGR
jgi:hypothetical protein